MTRPDRSMTALTAGGIALLILALVGDLAAQGPQEKKQAKPPAKEAPSKAPKKPVRPTRAWGLDWYATVDPALIEARRRSAASPKDPKLVLWVRILGELAGKA
ncbi:MAG: hypothetical protein R3F20_12975 [Planctomycetota bacterium]